MRLAIALGALAISAASVPLTVLPRPPFPGPAAAPTGAHRLVLVSSRKAPIRTSISVDFGATPYRGFSPVGAALTANRNFAFYGPDAASARLLVASTKSGKQLYAFDFKNYVWPPRIRPGDREFVYEQPVWAQEANGTLYVETAHSTYAKSSYGQNAYVTAIDLASMRATWRSPALVANAAIFLVAGPYLVTGYGFTAEEDYLYLLDRRTGRVVDRLLLPSAPETMTRRGSLVHVRTYDHVVSVRLRGV